jgi:hypothetical protein
MLKVICYQWLKVNAFYYGLTKFTEVINMCALRYFKDLFEDY